jgi:hypothetical protein
MIAHQAPRMNSGLIAYAHLAQAADEQTGIFLTLENISTLIPATHDVISRTGVFNSKGSGHAEKVGS